MAQVAATLNEGFAVLIDYTPTDDGHIEDITVLDPDTGKDLTPLVAYSSTAWNQAWTAAERHLLATPASRKTRSMLAANMAAMCHDTPFAYGVAA